MEPPSSSQLDRIVASTTQVLIPQNNRDSLTAWLSLYMKIDGETRAEQTRIAKTQDLERFLDYYSTVVGSDSKPDMFWRSTFDATRCPRNGKLTPHWKNCSDDSMGRSRLLRQASRFTGECLKRPEWYGSGSSKRQTRT